MLMAGDIDAVGAVLPLSEDEESPLARGTPARVIFGRLFLVRGFCAV